MDWTTGPKMILQMQEVTVGTGEDVINHKHNQYFDHSGRSHLNQQGLHHIHIKGRWIVTPMEMVMVITHQVSKGKEAIDLMVHILKTIIMSTTGVTRCEVLCTWIPSLKCNL